MSFSDVVSIPCHAKVNLGLRVLAPREDGYHEVRTILHTVGLHDTLEVRKASRISLDVREEWACGRGGSVPRDAGNLVLKAAEAVKGHLGRRGAAFTLTKRVPPGSGMGAASSDAAAALVAMNRLFGLDLDPQALHRAAATLGSDVPFFLYGGACLALGKGDEIFPLPEGPSLHLVLVFPVEGLSTPLVYRRWDDLLTSEDKTSRMNDFAPWCLVLRGGSPSVANDLERAAIELRPSLVGVRSALLNSGAKAVSMTGSGSAFFGIYSGARQAEHAALLLKRAGLAAVPTSSLGRREWETAISAGER
jgi:4-diphosphocytidyl-2-C-methyl-D-erythritol kinase